jgi:hypothetical protein
VVKRLSLALSIVPDGFVWSHLQADRRLRRHGASRAERDAFAGEVHWPAGREPATDPVDELLGGSILPEPALAG